MGWDLVVLAPFLVEPKPPALPLGIEVISVHREDSPDPGETEHHHPDERPVPEACNRCRVDRLKEEPGLSGGQNGRFPFLQAVLWAANRTGRIGGNHLADHQEIKEHPDGRKVLLHRWLCEGLSEVFDVRRDEERVQILQPQLLALAPGGKLRHGPRVGGPGVGVSDVGGEKFHELPGSLLTGFRKDGRDGIEDADQLTGSHRDDGAAVALGGHI